MNLNKKFSELAINLAINNVKNNNGGPFGAVIVKNNEIISTGVNTVIGNNDPTSHAEIMAIRETCKKLGTPFLNDCIIYSSCEPCPMCYSAIRWAKIDKIYYSNTRKEAKQIGFDDDKIYSEIIYSRQKMYQLSTYNQKIPFLLWTENKNREEY